LDWLQSVGAFDAALYRCLQKEQAVTFDARQPGWKPQVVERLRHFLIHADRGGHVLIKTSTAGGRPSTHEVANEILRLALSTAADVVTGRVVLADGPVYGDYGEECRRLGWDALAEEAGAIVQDLNLDKATYVDSTWPLSSMYLSADSVVNVTKAKTHRRFGVSLSEKALLGALVGAVTGYPKLERRHRHVGRLLELIARASPPLLSIVDGLGGVEGDGPMGGRPTQSAFLCVGTGTLGPDLRALVEMRFDPALTPGIIRPITPAPLGATAVNWQSLCVTQGESFLPPNTCPWLYRSLPQRRRRARQYRALMEGARDCWPSPSPD